MRALAAVSGDDRRYLIAPDRGEVDPASIVQALARRERADWRPGGSRICATSTSRSCLLR